MVDNLEPKQEVSKVADVSIDSNFDVGISREETSMQFETYVISTDLSQGQELIWGPTAAKCGNGLSMDIGSPDSTGSYNTAYEQEILSPKVDDKIKSTFAEKQGETVIEKYENPTVEAKCSVERFNIALSSKDWNIHAEVTEVSKVKKSEEPTKIPLQYEEQTITTEAFNKNSYGSETVASNVDSIIAETVPSAFKEDQESYSEKLGQHQISEEKQVVTLGRTDSGKSNIPLFSFLKEESYSAGSQQEQERLVANNAIEENRILTITQSWLSLPKEERNASLGLSSSVSACVVHKISTESTHTSKFNLLTHVCFVLQRGCVLGNIDGGVQWIRRRDLELLLESSGLRFSEEWECNFGADARKGASLPKGHTQWRDGRPDFLAARIEHQDMA
ncbi:hypothetical protein IFM89_030807 [Coptis chinensis]|uniref:Uncharacterized protein n=1 Tax=Coptis chinensis TaxID=261450 RepID=A0A835HXK8_9MAGN|nr:hypothetical protein IFM89_030807 [Coptis chinensis]